MPYDHLIVGGGMVADAAARGIRAQDAEATIAIVGEEPTVPFPRPALTKRLWTDPAFTFEQAALHTETETGAILHLGQRVVSIDVDAHTVGTDDGNTYAYRRLLLATGGQPRRVDGLEPGERVLYFHTLRDYERLRDLASERPHVVVVGGGFVGSEIAAALVQHDCRVTLVHPDDLLGARMFPTTLARIFHGLFTEAGVEVRGGLQVTGGQQRADGVTLELSDGTTVAADVAVLGLGTAPSAEPRADGLKRAEDGGIVVDDRLATSLTDVWAAGDVVEYPDRILGRRRVEHVDNAAHMGAVAGRNMAGSDETYDHTPMFYSDVLGHGYEAIGTIDAGLEVVQDPHDDGLVVYYLDDSEVRGVLLWDCDGGIDAARELLARHDRPADASELIGAVRA